MDLGNQSHMHAPALVLGITDIHIPTIYTVVGLVLPRMSKYTLRVVIRAANVGVEC